jgi:hypothetical protein
MNHQNTDPTVRLDEERREEEKKNDCHDFEEEEGMAPDGKVDVIPPSNPDTMIESEDAAKSTIGFPVTPEKEDCFKKSTASNLITETTPATVISLEESSTGSMVQTRWRLLLLQATIRFVLVKNRQR